MAGGAGSRLHIHVSEARAHPCGGAMAGVARLVGKRMVGRLALGDAVVVALDAPVGCYANVSKPRHLPCGGRGMTLTARLHCRDVILGFDRGSLNTAARRMAGFAFFGRALESALNVTGFAGKCHVCPSQREAGFDVIAGSRF